MANIQLQFSEAAVIHWSGTVLHEGSTIVLTLRCSSLLSGINEYLAISSGGYNVQTVCVQ